MFEPERFHTSTLLAHARGDAVLCVLASAFNAVEAGAAVKKYLRENPLRAAQSQAQKEAFETLIFRTGLQGEASVIGREK